MDKTALRDRVSPNTRWEIEQQGGCSSDAQGLGKLRQHYHCRASKLKDRNVPLATNAVFAIFHLGSGVARQEPGWWYLSMAVS